MKNVRYLTLAVLAIIFATTANAQKGDLKLGIKYSMGMPSGSFKDYIPENSYRGWNADLLYGISDKISVGLGTGYQDYYQKNPRQLYKGSDGTDISAVLTHSIQTIPILLTGKYSFSPGAVIQPYAALGVGGNLVMFGELLGEFGGTETKFGFAARPEAGVFVPFRKGGQTGLTVGASYNYMPFNHNDFSSLSNIGINAGITFPLRR